MSKIQHSAIIPKDLAGRRIDQALSQLFPQHSRARLTRWIRQHEITLDQQTVKPKDKVCGGEQVIIDADLVETQPSWTAHAIDIEIIYEDETLLVINKAAGLVVHPATGHLNDTLVNALLHHRPELAHLPRAGILHRLDKDTSGLLVVAKTLTAHTHLVTALQKREIKRQYIAVVNGMMITGGEVDAPIGRHRQQRLKMAVTERGKAAQSQY
ncbi:MAG: pseudouridine synthase, partial [Gammaproteobacteria bacterium]